MGSGDSPILIVFNLRCSVMTDKCVMVTGGAGYIGSHVTLDLLANGWNVVVVDTLATSARPILPAGAVFVHGNAGDVETMARLMILHRCRAVLHFAGSTVVPESVTDPLRYYDNNSAVSRSLIAACGIAGVNRMIFSSTAAIYGNPERLPVTEDQAPNPITPYGTSKLVTEHMLRDVAAATPLRYVALRYFNVAGADPAGRAGQSTPQASHLIKVACEVAVGTREFMALYGDDYDTADGTCVRDFIHVSDLAAAHVAALDYLMAGGDSQILNCGYGSGISVRQIIDTTAKLAGRALNVTVAPRRDGDIVVMVADSTRLRRLLRWVPRYDDIDTIVGSALAWEMRSAGASLVSRV
jgi:UDP-glucose 4-epimerase